MKGKVNGVWYDLISTDFEESTITINNGSVSVIKLQDIEELEKDPITLKHSMAAETVDFYKNNDR